MICPECKNRNFEPTEDLRSPLVNTGKKEKYDTVDYRRHVCLQCGYAFLTEETFSRAIQVNRNTQTELLFQDGNRQKKSKTVQS